jgi:uncharacterized protein involved in cysteine biosynthesis
MLWVFEVYLACLDYCDFRACDDRRASAGD